MKEKLKYLIAAGAISLALAGCGESGSSENHVPIRETVTSKLNCKGLNRESSEEVFLTQNGSYLFNYSVISATSEGITIFRSENHKRTSHKYDSTILEDGMTLPPIIVEDAKSHRFEITFKPGEQNGVSGMKIYAQLDCTSVLSINWPFI